APPFAGRKARADAAQRVDDAAHRPAAQRSVAGNKRGDRVGGENPEQQPRRGSGIAEIEQVFGLVEAADPDTVHGPSAVARRGDLLVELFSSSLLLTG